MSHWTQSSFGRSGLTAVPGQTSQELRRCRRLSKPRRYRGRCDTRTDTLDAPSCVLDRECQSPISMGHTRGREGAQQTQFLTVARRHKELVTLADYSVIGGVIIRQVNAYCHRTGRIGSNENRVDNTDGKA